MREKRAIPSVMIYFESVRPALKRLNDEQCGKLFRAILDYAENGVVADLDTLTGMVFDLLVPLIDRDAERYEEKRRANEESRQRAEEFRRRVEEDRRKQFDAR